MRLTRRLVTTYHAYGLDIDSEVALPELAHAASSPPPTVSIRFGRVEKIAPNVEDREHFVSPDEIVLSYPEVARFRVAGGREIIIDPQPDADDAALRLCLLGPALGALLHQRGLLVLHASAVNIGGGASIFLGNKGWGKSTLAASLNARGHGLVADDIVGVEMASDGVPRVAPGFPQLKLWPQAAEFLGFDVNTLPRLLPDIEKRDSRADGSFQVAALPLRRIYVIDLGDRVEIEPVEPREAMVELVQHSYLLRFLPATCASVPHFRQCSALVQSLGLYRLKRPAGIQLLPQVAELLEAHAH